MFHQQQANIHSVRLHPVEKSIASSWYIWSSLHWKVKSVQIRSYFWYAFSFIRTEYGDLLRNLCIQSECRKMEIRKNSVFGHFSRRVSLKIKLETKTISLFRVAIQTLKYGQKVLLTHFMPLVSFDTPWKHQQARGFPMFSGGIERHQLYEMV